MEFKNIIFVTTLVDEFNGFVKMPLTTILLSYLILISQLNICTLEEIYYLICF